MKFSSTKHLIFITIFSFSTVVFAKTVKFAAQESPPFSYLERGKPEGASAEIMKKVCAQLNWTCELEIFPFKRALIMTESGEIDGVWGVIKTPEREKTFTLSNPVWSSNLSFMGIKGVTVPVIKVENLSGFTVAGVRGSSSLKRAEEIKEKISDMKIIEANSYPEAFKSLFANSFGPKAVVATYEDVGNYIARKDNFANLVTIYEIEKVQFRVGFSKKADSKIVDAFNKTVEELRRSGELKKILATVDMKE